MRILVLSDIHANLIALEAVLADAAGLWDKLWFLGDLVGYGPDPDDCVRLLREHDPLCLCGNHDWAVLGRLDMDDFNQEARRVVSWTQEMLTEESKTFLEGLSPQLVEVPFTLAHASPRYPIWEYILDLETALENFAHFDTPVCLVGHSHVPALFVLDEPANQLSGYVVGADEVVELTGKRFILNPGSVGQPRDADPRAAYALLDTDRMHWQYRRVAYNVAETQQRMRRLGMPLRLVQRLEYGV